MQSELPKPSQAKEAPENFLEFMTDNWFFVGAVVFVFLIYLLYLRLLRKRKNKGE